MKKATVKTKKVTIGDLASMMSKGFSDVNKKIAEGREETSELARMVAKGFESVDRRFEKVENEISEVKKDITEVKKDVLEVKENLGAPRMDVLGIGDRFVSKHEFSQHLIRFNLLEQTIKVKLKK